MRMKYLDIFQNNMHLRFFSNTHLWPFYNDNKKTIHLYTNQNQRRIKKKMKWLTPCFCYKYISKHLIDLSTICYEIRLWEQKQENKKEKEIKACQFCIRKNSRKEIGNHSHIRIWWCFFILCIKRRKLKKKRK